MRVHALDKGSITRLCSWLLTVSSTVKEVKQVNQNGRQNLITNIIGVITLLLSLLGVLIAYIELSQGVLGGLTDLSLVAGAIGLISIWLVCLYIFVRKRETRDSRSRSDKKLRKPYYSFKIRRVALVGIILIPVLSGAGIDFYVYHQNQPPDQLIVLIADFDGPEPEKYRITETVLTHLSQALANYRDLEVRALGRPITAAEGGAIARREGERQQAFIVIWGWYGVTSQTVPLSIHFEVIRAPEQLPVLGPEATGLVRTLPRSDLESFTLQPKISAEMAYIGLFCAGMIRYANGDTDAAIDRFTDALRQTSEPVPALDQSIVLTYRGMAYLKKVDADSAIPDFDQAIKLNPQNSEAYRNRARAYSWIRDYSRALNDANQAVWLEPKAASYVARAEVYSSNFNHDDAIADLNVAIEMEPDNVDAYISRGRAYTFKGNYDQAIADFNYAISIKSGFDGYFYRSVAYTLKGDFEKSNADLKNSLAYITNRAVTAEMVQRLHTLSVATVKAFQSKGIPKDR